MNSIKTIAQLKASGYKPKSVKQEMRENLIAFLKEGKNPFEGIQGYDETVLPQLQTSSL